MHAHSTIYGRSARVFQEQRLLINIFKVMTTHACRINVKVIFINFVAYSALKKCITAYKVICDMSSINMIMKSVQQCSHHRSISVCSNNIKKKLNKNKYWQKITKINSFFVFFRKKKPVGFLQKIVGNFRLIKILNLNLHFNRRMHSYILNHILSPSNISLACILFSVHIM